jgi:hypothetical protein
VRHGAQFEIRRNCAELIDVEPAGGRLSPAIGRAYKFRD